MNVMIGARNNISGLLSAEPAKRDAARNDIQSMVKARLLSSVNKARSTQTKSDVLGSAETELDRDAFLRLLVYEMQNQDPLEPVENSEMIAQLAQFSALEQMSNLNEQFEVLSGNIDQLNFISATALVGRTVSGIDVNGQACTGVVERVHLDGSIVYLTVDGSLMSMAGVLGIE